MRSRRDALERVTFSADILRSVSLGRARLLLTRLRPNTRVRATRASRSMVLSHMHPIYGPTLPNAVRTSSYPSRCNSNCNAFRGNSADYPSAPPTATKRASHLASPTYHAAGIHVGQGSRRREGHLRPVHPPDGPARSHPARIPHPRIVARPIRRASQVRAPQDPGFARTPLPRGCEGLQSRVRAKAEPFRPPAERREGKRVRDARAGNGIAGFPKGKHDDEKGARGGDFEECAESRRAGGPAQRRSTETSGATAEKGSLRGEGSARGREVARGRLGGARLHLPFVRAEG